ncbi:MAG: exonuclease domain-containing protein [Geminicoccaceae bacterium]|nr:exonuclease domain-containing protein [Geminicoccaceae bacterium]MCX7629529.1 exonuclease domain-containing protein [Geminicoccaceae bacterium]MDW8340860.1 exonuclease domain-containing protein [Geminicoccaceae bacterium]
MVEGRRLVFWVSGALALAVFALAVFASAALHDTAPGRGGAALAFGSLLAVAVLAAAVLVDRWLLAPARALARSIEIVLATGRASAAPLPARHALGALPLRVGALVERVVGAEERLGEERARAKAAAEADRRRLAAILRDIGEGLIHAAPDGRILLYNDAAVTLLGAPAGLGLGRSVFEVLSHETLAHHLDLLRRLARGDASVRGSEPFIVTAAETGRLLRCRLSLVGDEPPGGEGFVLVLAEASVPVSGGTGRLLDQLESGWRGPVAAIRAAAEVLRESALDEQTAWFTRVVVEETARLEGLLCELAAEARAMVLQQWPLYDVATGDLAEVLAERLAARGIDVRLGCEGESAWASADSGTLVVLLASFLERLAQKGVTEATLSARNRSHGVTLRLAWRGPLLEREEFETWLASRLEGWGLPFTPREIAERHGSEPWLASSPEGGVLHLPLSPPKGVHQVRAPPALPARPEFYDFELAAAPASLESQPLRQASYVVFDCETTGLDVEQDDLLQLAAVRVVNGRVIYGEVFDCLVDPGRSIPEDSIRFHGITPDMIVGKPPPEVVVARFARFAQGAVLVAHNAAFDLSFLHKYERRAGVRFEQPVLDTLLIAAFLEDHRGDHSLDGVAARLGIPIRGRHTALGDSLATAEILVRLLSMLEARGIKTLGEAIRASRSMVEIRRQRARPVEAASRV